MKSILISPPVLAFPDLQKPFVLGRDASGAGIGAVLSKVNEDGTESVIAYASKSLSHSQKNYSVTKRELFAVVEFTDTFSHYLLGTEFTLRTDHRALVWLSSFKEPTGLLVRWLERLSRFAYVIRHRPGSKHTNAGALSRIPIRDDEVSNHENCPVCAVDTDPVNNPDSPEMTQCSFFH